MVVMVVEKISNVVRGMKQRWGTSTIKRALWNQEFVTGRWDFIENTREDLVYPYLVKYCKHGSVLDLGCGSGNTGCELDASAYHDYTGVDISDVAIEKAQQRSANQGRSAQNRYHQSDIMTYIPDKMYDVILLRESIGYIPRSKVKAVLERYAHFLKQDGVFIIRWCDTTEGEAMLDRAKNECKVLEKLHADHGGPFLIVMQWNTARLRG